MVTRSLDEWLKLIQALHPEEIELGLERVSAVAIRMSLLPVAKTVVTVAGTNGKGSTIAALDALLLRSGLKTGRYTSPHLLRYNERVCISGEPVSDALLVQAFEAVELVRGDTQLTYFEYGTLAALHVFLRSDVDVLLLEVGLGGRLDAVNIVDPDVTVITRIDLDHESWLGTTREEIGLEKAGILRAGVPLVCADEHPPQTLRQRARELGCPAYYLGQDFPSLPMAALLHGDNLAAAIKAAELLGCDTAPLDPIDIVAGTHLTGRLQRQTVEGIVVWLDVAHNPAAVEHLAQQLRKNPSAGKRVALFAALSDKNIRAMIRSCNALFDAWFVADLPGVTRAATSAELAATLRDAGEAMVSESKNPKQAYRRAMKLLQTGDELVVFGSFYTIAACLGALERDRSKA